MQTEPQAISPDERWVSLAREAHNGSSTWFDTNVRSRVINDIRQFQGEHPEGSKYLTDSYRLKSKLFRPKTRTAIRKGEAEAASAYFASEDVVAVRPVDDDDPEQQAAAKFHKALLQYRLTRPHPAGLPWFLTLCGGVQEALAVGAVASYQDWKVNPSKGIDRPDITLLPIENYRFDPACDWRDVVNSSPYFIIKWPMYVKDIRAKMQHEDATKRWKQYDDAQIKSAIQSNDTIRQVREKGTDSKASTTLSDFAIAWVHENFMEIDGEDVVFFTLGTEFLLSDPVPVTERYPQGRPVVVGFSIVEAHKTYKPSLATLTKEIQAEINDVTNLRIDGVKLGQRPRHIVKRGGQVDLRALTRAVPGSVVLANSIDDIKPILSDNANASSYQEQDRLNLDFDDMAGAFSGASVMSNRTTGETVGGMNIISSNANQVSEYQLRTINETWVEHVLRQVIILEQHYETDPVVLAYAAKQAGVEIPEGATANDVISEEFMRKDVILNVSVGTGTANPQMQLERFAFGMQTVAKVMPQVLTSLNSQEIIKELFSKLGYKDGLRFFAQQQEDPEKAQMQQQIQQLEDALKAKNPPELVAAQVAKLEAESAAIKVKAMVDRVEALFAAMNTAQTAVQVPGVMPVADAIAKSAGFEDQDAPDIYPMDAQPQEIPAEAQIPQNTSPMFPAQADNGMMEGIEGGGIEGRATGGPVVAGVPYVVGEKGPELIIPSQNGQVLDDTLTRQFMAEYGSHFTNGTEDQLTFQKVATGGAGAAALGALKAAQLGKFGLAKALGKLAFTGPASILLDDLLSPKEAGGEDDSTKIKTYKRPK